MVHPWQKPKYWPFEEQAKHEQGDSALVVLEPESDEIPDDDYLANSGKRPTASKSTCWMAGRSLKPRCRGGLELPRYGVRAYICPHAGRARDFQPRGSLDRLDSCSSNRRSSPRLGGCRRQYCLPAVRLQSARLASPAVPNAATNSSGRTCSIRSGGSTPGCSKRTRDGTSRRSFARLPSALCREGSGCR